MKSSVTMGLHGTERASAALDMELQPLVPAHWERINHALIDLTAFVGLALTAAFGLLLARLVGTSAVGAGAVSAEASDGSGQLALIRRAGQLIAVIAALAMLFGLGRSLVTMFAVVADIFPRLLI